MAKLIEEKPIDIPVKDMEVGSMGVITSWGSLQYKGRILQRIPGGVFIVGINETGFWTSPPTSDDCRVRILEPGTKIQL